MRGIALQSLAPGVTQIAVSGRNNVFLVEGDDGLTVIDVGRAKAPLIILRAIRLLGHRPNQLRRIVLTHAHPDHVQGATALRRVTGARILIHVADAHWLLRGRMPAGQRFAALGGLIDVSGLIDRIPWVRWTPFVADDVLNDGDRIDGAGGLRVVHTPGHTPGHIALLHEPTATVLVGDAVIHRGGLRLGRSGLAVDPRGRAAGAAHLPLDVAAVGFAHGAPLEKAEVDAFRDFVLNCRAMLG